MCRKVGTITISYYSPHYYDNICKTFCHALMSFGCRIWNAIFLCIGAAFSYLYMTAILFLLSLFHTRWWNWNFVVLDPKMCIWTQSCYSVLMFILCIHSMLRALLFLFILGSFVSKAVSIALMMHTLWSKALNKYDTWIQGLGQIHICAGEQLPTSWYSRTCKDSLVNPPAN